MTQRKTPTHMVNIAHRVTMYPETLRMLRAGMTSPGSVVAKVTRMKTALTIPAVKGKRW